MCPHARRKRGFLFLSESPHVVYAPPYLIAFYYEALPGELPLQLALAIANLNPSKLNTIMDYVSNCCSGVPSVN
jgi:hypothetical protein